MYKSYSNLVNWSSDLRVTGFSISLHKRQGYYLQIKRNQKPNSTLGLSLLPSVCLHVSVQLCIMWRSDVSNFIRFKTVADAKLILLDSFKPSTHKKLLKSEIKLHTPKQSPSHATKQPKNTLDQPPPATCTNEDSPSTCNDYVTKYYTPTEKFQLSYIQPRRGANDWLSYHTACFIYNKLVCFVYYRQHYQP